MHKNILIDYNSMLKIAKQFSPFDPKKRQNLSVNGHTWSLCT